MSRRSRPYLWALGLLWVLPTVLFLLGYAALPHDVPPEACEGIGFGCQLSPADALALVAVMVGVPVFGGAGLVAVLAVAVVQRRRDRHRASS